MRTKATMAKSSQQTNNSKIFIDNCPKPILVIILGMLSDETEMYAQNTVREAWAKGYLPVIV
jgi:hypothetical protein